MYVLVDGGGNTEDSSWNFDLPGQAPGKDRGMPKRKRPEENQGFSFAKDGTTPVQLIHDYTEQ